MTTPTTPGTTITLADLAWIRSFDRIVISTSGGKDSTATAARMFELALAAGVADRIVFVHADLGRVEWQANTTETFAANVSNGSTLDLVREHAEHFGNARLEIVQRDLGDILEHSSERGKYAGFGTTQWCTSDHKTAQIKKLFVRLGREFKAETGSRHIRILDVQGLRADEGPKRNRKFNGGEATKNQKASGPMERRAGGATCPNPRAGCGIREVVCFYPIADWTESEVWARIAADGLRSHWAYAVGMPRLSCVFCIYAPRDALRLAGKYNPELLDQFIAVEEKNAHAFSQDAGGLVWLSEIRDDIRRDPELLEIGEISWGDQG